MFKGAGYILEVFDILNCIKGRKKLQKIIHLLENYGEDIPYKYSYHYYGPYSAQLQEEIDFLVQQGFLKQTRQNETYLYNITDYGREFKNKIKENYYISLNKELLEELNNQSSQFLEMVSTYAFLLEMGYEKAEAQGKALELKPHLKNLIDEAVEFLKSYIN